MFLLPTIICLSHVLDEEWILWCYGKCVECELVDTYGFKV